MCVYRYICCYVLSVYYVFWYIHMFVTYPIQNACGFHVVKGLYEQHNTTAGFKWPAISERYRKYLVCIVFYIYNIYFIYDVFTISVICMWFLYLYIIMFILYTYELSYIYTAYDGMCKFHHMPGCSRTLRLSLWSLRPVVDLDPRSGKATTAKGKTSKGRKKPWVVKGKGWYYPVVWWLW